MKYYIIFLFIFFATATFAQNTSEKSSSLPTFMDKCYGEAGMYIGQIFSKKTAMQTHFSLHVVFRKKYHVGAVYERLTNFTRADLFQNDSVLRGNYAFKYQSAGIRFGYEIFPAKKYHLQPQLTVNWGMYRYDNGPFTIRRWNFAVLVPALQFSYDLHKNVALGAGVSYRTHIGIKGALSNRDLNGIYGNLFLRIGIL